MAIFRRPSVRYGRTPEPETPYQRAAQAWDERIGSARVQAKNWRLMAFGSLALSVGLAGGLVWQSTHGSIVPWVVQVDKLGQAQAVAPADGRLHADRSADRLVSRPLHRGWSARCRPIRSSCGRTGSTPTTSPPPPAPQALNDYARANDPFAKLGKQQIAIDVSSVIRASPDQLPRRMGRAPLPGRRARRHLALDRDPHHRDPDAHRRRRAAQEPARHLRQRHQLVEGAGTMTPPISMEAGSPASRFSAIQQSRKGGIAAFRKAGLAALLMSVTALGGCAHNFIPPDINYDSAAPAKLTVDPPAPVKIVELPKPLPLPGQLKPLAGGKPPPEAADPDRARQPGQRGRARAAGAQRLHQRGAGLSVSPAGALYQVYTAPGEITDIALQEGEQLVGTGPVAAGDTVRWIIGDTESGAGADQEGPHPGQADAAGSLTNLVINTDRRTYLLELRSTEKTYMASVSWQYPEDQLIALRRQNQAGRGSRADRQPASISPRSTSATRSRATTRPGGRCAPSMTGRRSTSSSRAASRQGEMPPLFVIGPAGGSELVNYRVNRNYYIVDRLFAAAELRLGDKDSERRVRIVRTDGRPRS